MNNKWNERFLGLAKEISLWSKDTSTKGGAVIVRPDKTIASCGYNGFPRGCRDDLMYYEDREKKYARMIHAEMNAILHAREPLNGYTLYVYVPGIGPTCDRCAPHVIQAGISEIVYYAFDVPKRWEESIQRSLEIYDEARVKIVPFD